MNREDEMLQLLRASYNALRSYQYGNTATELAKEIADRIEKFLLPGTTLT